MTITLRSDFEVTYIDGFGTDEFICKAARVSTLGSASLESSESAGLINFLMKNRHGSPFEHAGMSFRISAPIFVWREFMRHRIGTSYNEQSGRYMKLEPMFYVPPAHRPLVQDPESKAGEYRFIPGTVDQQATTVASLMSAYRKAWSTYEMLLDDGIAKEVARMCLPVAIYSTAYVTWNPRSIMHFLSLRTKVEGSTFPSFPQWEINQVANDIEADFSTEFPLTYKAFGANGRVCP